MTKRDITELETLVEQLWKEMRCTGECPRCGLAIKTRFDYCCPVDAFSDVIYCVLKNPSKWREMKESASLYD